MAWQKGQSGNPAGGKARERTLWERALLNALDATDPTTQKRKIELAAESLVRCAVEGDVIALKEIGDRVDGKAIARSDPVDVNVTGYGAALIEAARRRAAGEE